MQSKIRYMKMLNPINGKYDIMDVQNKYYVRKNVKDNEKADRMLNYYNTRNMMEGK